MGEGQERIGGGIVGVSCCEQEVFISCTFCRGRLLKENSATRLCLYHL